MLGFTYSLFLEPLSDSRVKLVVDLLEVTKAGLSSGRGGCNQAAEEEGARRSWKKGHLQVLRDWEVSRELRG